MYRNILAEMTRRGYSREFMTNKLNISLPTFRKKINGIIPWNMNEILKILSIFRNEFTFEYLFQKEEQVQAD